MNYMMVLPVRHFRIDESRVAIESAFAGHLRMMQTAIEETGGKLVVASPSMTGVSYESVKNGLSIIDETIDGINFQTLFYDDAIRSSGDKIRLFRPLMRRLYALAKESYCIHSSPSWDALIPFEFASIVSGIRLKRRTVFVVDIDYRKSAYMSYKSGDWSLKSYLVCKSIYDVVRSLQLVIASKYCSLVLLKGKKLAKDFGKGRPNVKDFLDSSHSEKNIIPPEQLSEKIRAIHNTSQPLRLAYFGRLTAYKGIDRCLRAVALARQSNANVTLDIVGGGDQQDMLVRLTHELGIDDCVFFHGPMLFDQKLFHLLYQFHVLLAAPLREDTPRSVLDAMAAGMSYLAFDTYYYRQLMESGAGSVVPWADLEAMAQNIVRLEKNRETVARMAEAAVAYSRCNTQEIWLDRRMAWTMNRPERRPVT